LDEGAEGLSACDLEGWRDLEEGVGGSLSWAEDFALEPGLGLALDRPDLGVVGADLELPPCLLGLARGDDLDLESDLDGPAFIACRALMPAPLKPGATELRLDPERAGDALPAR
jgi:hypothetical protein